MSIPGEIERFAKDVALNPALLRELKTVGTDRALVVAFANSKGYTFSLEDVNRLSGSGQLTDEQLDGVVGGAVNALVVDGDGLAFVYASSNHTLFIWW